MAVRCVEAVSGMLRNLFAAMLTSNVRIMATVLLVRLQGLRMVRVSGTHRLGRARTIYVAWMSVQLTALALDVRYPYKWQSLITYGGVTTQW